MENFKISVDVNVKFSEETIKAIASIFANATAAPAPAKPATDSKPATAAPAAKPATAAPAAKPAAPAAKPAAPAAKPTAPAAKPASDAVPISIDEVRSAVALKVADYRQEIKDKLTELGAPSVTKLDPAKYKDMLDFINSLGGDNYGEE